MWFLDEKERTKLCELGDEDKALLAGWLMSMVPIDRRMCGYFLFGNRGLPKVERVQLLMQAVIQF